MFYVAFAISLLAAVGQATNRARHNGVLKLNILALASFREATLTFLLLAITAGNPIIPLPVPASTWRAIVYAAIVVRYVVASIVEEVQATRAAAPAAASSW